MPRALSVASGTTGVQAIVGKETIVGFSARENAATAAAATIVLRDGTDATGAIVAVIELAADSSQTAKIPAVDCHNGIYVDRVAGETELAIYVL